MRLDLDWDDWLVLVGVVCLAVAVWISMPC